MAQGLLFLLLLLLVFLNVSVLPSTALPNISKSRALSIWRQFLININKQKEKKDESIKSAEECAQMVGKILGKKPAQMWQMMRNKMYGIDEIMRKIESKVNYFEFTKEDEETFKMLHEKYRKFIAEIGIFLRDNPLGLDNLLEVNEHNLLEFGHFRIDIREWRPRHRGKVYLFHKREEDGLFDELTKLMGQLSDEAKQKLEEYWYPFDAMMENLMEILRKTDKFIRALTGRPGKFVYDLEAEKLGVAGTEGDPRLGKMMHLKIWDELNEDVANLRRVKKYLADPKNADVRYQIRNEGRIVSEFVRQNTWTGPGDAPKIIINEVHDTSFFEDLFAPYLEEFFEILTKDRHNGGFVFKLMTMRKDYEDVLAVDVGQVIEVGGIKKEGRGKMDEEEVKGEEMEEMAHYEYYPFNEEWAELEENPEEAGKPKNPLHLDSHLLSHLLTSLYAKIVARMEHLQGKRPSNLVKDPRDLTLIFHAYTFALAGELYRRMGEVQESYDVFYSAEDSVEENDIPQSPIHQQETPLEKEKLERWENLQKLYAKVEEKRATIMRETVTELPAFLGLMGYTDMGQEVVVERRAEMLAKTMGREMAMTLDNLELNWAVDCHVDDIEKCLFAENNDIDFDLAEMSLFSESKDQMSKVQQFFDWIYKKLNRRIRKMTHKFQKEGNPVKAFFMGKCIEILEEFGQLMENRIGIADLFIPFYSEFKTFVATPIYEGVANSKLMAMLLGIRAKIKEFVTAQNSPAHVGLAIFEMGNNKLAENMAGIGEKLAKGNDGRKAIASAFKSMVRFLLSKFGFFSHFKEHFRITKLPELSKLFGKLRKMLRRKKHDKLETAITARTGIRKEWHSKWAHKMVVTVAINAAYRPINIVVVKHGDLAAFGVSTGFFILTIVFMTSTLWLCRHLLWHISCGATFPHCGHYISVAFAIIAAGVWMGLMIAVF